VKHMKVIIIIIIIIEYSRIMLRMFLGTTFGLTTGCHGGSTLSIKYVAYIIYKTFTLLNH
jgi:hypothetical protein